MKLSKLLLTLMSILFLWNNTTVQHTKGDNSYDCSLSMRLLNERTETAHLHSFFQSKTIDIFLISPQKHMLWVLIRSPSASNEYPQHMFFVEK